jgi:hypothetical protein
MTLHGATVVEVGIQPNPTFDTRYLGRLVSSCPATATPVATACTGTTGPLALAVDVLPWLGATCRATADGFAPGALGLALTGLSSPGTPLAALHPAGRPNCALLASAEAAALVVPVAGAAAWQFAVPDDPALIGVQLQHQFLQAEFAGGALAALSASNALQLVVGVF